MWSLVLSIFLAVWVLDDISSQVAHNPLTICFVPLVALLPISDYAIRLALAIDANCDGRRSARPGRGAWRWLVLPAAAALVASGLADPWPMAVRFGLSRAAFERKAAEVLANDTDQGGQRVGLYWVKRVEVVNAEVQFVTGTSIIDPVGFAYNPKRPPTHPFYRHLDGNWYAAEW
jgi:hypothetical protein